MHVACLHVVSDLHFNSGIYSVATNGLCSPYALPPSPTSTTCKFETKTHPLINTKADCILVTATHKCCWIIRSGDSCHIPDKFQQMHLRRALQPSHPLVVQKTTHELVGALSVAFANIVWEADCRAKSLTSITGKKVLSIIDSSVCED